MSGLVGVLSDTHDDTEAIARAVKLFNARGVDLVLHAGDFVSPFTVEVLGGLDAPLTGIFGNNDGDRLLLNERYGGAIRRQPHTLETGGRRVMMVHEPAAVEALARSGLYDVVIFGHTHRPEVRAAGETLVVNPGKAARLHRGRATAGIFEAVELRFEVVDLFG